MANLGTLLITKMGYMFTGILLFFCSVSAYFLQ